MEKKTLFRYLFLCSCIIAVSILLPSLISYVSGNVSGHIRGIHTEETETETDETEKTDGRYSVGNPDEYVEDPNGNIFTSEEDIKAYKKYQDMVDSFSSYVSEFTTDTAAGKDVAEKEMKAFLKKNREQFFEAAASYAYSRWGTERKIRTIKFDSIISYQDDNGDDITQAMVEFLHTDHPETEKGDMVICIYYKADGFYYFP